MKKRVTKTDFLQSLWDKLCKQNEASIEYRPFRGWFAVFEGGRHFGDEGELLGVNAGEAEQQIRWLWE